MYIIAVQKKKKSTINKPLEPARRMTQRASCWFYGRNSFRCDGLSSRGHVRWEFPTELSLRAGRVCSPCVCLTGSVTRSAFRPMEKGITTSSTSYVPPHICQNSKPSSWVREPPRFHTGFQHNSNSNTFAHLAFLVATFSMILA